MIMDKIDIIVENEDKTFIEYLDDILDYYEALEIDYDIIIKKLYFNNESVVKDIENFISNYEEKMKRIKKLYNKFEDKTKQDLLDDNIIMIKNKFNDYINNIMYLVDSI